METCITLYKPFLLGIFQDICDLYPDEISSEHKHGCENIIKSLKIHDVIQLCKIGKMIERSLITGVRLPLEKFPSKFSSEALGAIFYNVDGFPKLLENCFERTFRRDGSLVISDRILDLNFSSTSETTQFLGTDGNPSNEFQLDTTFVQLAAGSPEAQSFALAALCLRQLYLGCSKIRNWECLRRRNFGDQHFSYAGHCPFSPDISKFFNTICGKMPPEGTIGSGRFRIYITVC